MVEVQDSVFGRNLRAFRQSKGLTQPQIAEIAEVSVTSENKWERKGVQPRRHNVKLLMDHFGLSEDDLLSETNGFYAKLHGLTNAPAGAIHVTSSPARMVPVRVLGAVHAGDADEPWELDGEAMLLESLAQKHPRCFALEVNGSCMDRVFTDQDYIYADPDMAPKDNSIAVMMVDGQSVVRRVRMGSDSMMLVSESHEPHPDMIVKDSEAKCLGVVFWWQSKTERE